MGVGENKHEWWVGMQAMFSITQRETEVEENFNYELMTEPTII